MVTLNLDKADCKKAAEMLGEYSANLCDYILDTGQRRGCKCGVGCEKRILKEKNNENHA